MNQVNKPTFFILAANGRENELLGLLDGSKLAYKEVVGMYKGVLERSFLVVDETITIEDSIRSLARQFKQESYLKVNADTRESFLIYPNSLQVESIGVFTEVSEAEALAQSAYTFDPMTDQHFIVK